MQDGEEDDTACNENDADAHDDDLADGQDDDECIQEMIAELSTLEEDDEEVPGVDEPVSVAEDL